MNPIRGGILEAPGTCSRRFHRPRARQGQPLHHHKRIARPICGSADGAAQALGACCRKPVEVQILSSAPHRNGDGNRFSVKIRLKNPDYSAKARKEYLDK